MPPHLLCCCTHVVEILHDGELLCLSGITSLAWHWPQWEYLHHGNRQTLQTNTWFIVPLFVQAWESDRKKCSSSRWNLAGCHLYSHDVTNGTKQWKKWEVFKNYYLIPQSHSYDWWTRMSYFISVLLFNINKMPINIHEPLFINCNHRSVIDTKVQGKRTEQSI